MPNPNWKPGVSGNPHGRPPKQRALTEILRRGGSKTVLVDGRNISRRRLIASMLWSLAATGEATFPDGKKLVFSPEDWLGVVKFIYAQLDGPPKQDIDVTTGGEKLCVVIRGPEDSETGDV